MPFHPSPNPWFELTAITASTIPAPRDGNMTQEAYLQDFLRSRMTDFADSVIRTFTLFSVSSLCRPESRPTSTAEAR